MIQVLCLRGAGDLPAEPVIEPLLDSVADAVELGRNLINNGESLLTVAQTIAGEHEAMPGDVVHVALESGQVIAYMITSAALGYVDGIPATLLSGVKYEPSH